MDVAAAAGYLDVVKWLHANCTVLCTSRAMEDAAQHGYLGVVQWLHANRTEGCTTDAMNWAAGSNRLDVLQWLHANRTERCTSTAYTLAAHKGHADALIFLYSHYGSVAFPYCVFSDPIKLIKRMEVALWVFVNDPQNGVHIPSMRANPYTTALLNRILRRFEWTP